MTGRRTALSVVVEYDGDGWHYLYARISNDDKKRKTRDGRSREQEGVESQLRRLHAECDRRGVPKNRRVEFVDNDITASRFGTKEREDYAKLVKRIRVSRNCTVMAVEQSRIVRQELEGLQFKELMIANDMACALLTGDKDLTSQSGDMAWTMELFSNKHESENISRRVRSKFADDRAQGIMRSTRIAFGYADTLYTEHVDEQVAMLEKCRLHIMKGGKASLRDCVRFFTEAGFISPYRNGDNPPKPYTRRAITDMLRNPVYAGYQVHKDEILGRAKNVKPIWTVAEFQALQGALDANAEEFTSKRAPDSSVNARVHVLSGFVRCGKPECGAVARVTGRRDARVWRCPAPQDGGCGGTSRSYKLVQSVVNTWVREYLTMARVEATRDAAADPERLRLEADVAELEGRLVGLAEAYARPGYAVAFEDHMQMVMNLRDQITTRQKLLTGMVRDAERALPPDALLIWDDETPETLGIRRQMLGTMVDCVMILPVGNKVGCHGAPPESVRVIRRRTSDTAEVSDLAS